MPFQSLVDNRERAILWQLRHRDGTEAHGMTVADDDKVAALFFIGGVLKSSREFPTVHGANRWLERRLVQLQIEGWDFCWSPRSEARRLSERYH